MSFFLSPLGRSAICWSHSWKDHQDIKDQKGQRKRNEVRVRHVLPPSSPLLQPATKLNYPSSREYT